MLISRIFRLILIFVSVFTLYRFFFSDTVLMPIMYVPLLMGVAFEFIKLTKSFWPVLRPFCFALFIFILIYFEILVSFLFNKTNIIYEIDAAIATKAHLVLMAFVGLSYMEVRKKIEPRLTEGITLVQSISLIYWMHNMNIFNINNEVINFFTYLSLIFITFTFLHAFTKIKLGNNSRLFLSVFSTIIMMTFGIDYILRVFMNYDVYTLTLNGFLQYLLLGFSSIYLFQTFILLVPYIYTEKGKSYFKQVKKLNKTHINMYSEEQVDISESIYISIVISLIYYFNTIYQIFESYTLIWLVLLISPLLIFIKRKITQLVSIDS